MSKISIKRTGITEAEVDCVVNAANSELMAGGGVCGAIFRAAGYEKLTEACDRIGHCETGSAVITPGFKLKAKYIIHAVGPIWYGGERGEEEKLYSCYASSMRLAEEKGCASIAFPVISSGIYGYPKKEAWRVAIKAIKDYFAENPACTVEVIFTVLDEGMREMGENALKEAEG